MWQKRKKKKKRKEKKMFIVHWLTTNSVHCVASQAILKRITRHLQLSDGIIKWGYFKGFYRGYVLRRHTQK